MNLGKSLNLRSGIAVPCARFATGIGKQKRLALGLAFGAVALWATTAIVNDNAIFELDGDAVHNTQSLGGHDWDQVYNDSLTTPPGTSSGALATVFDPDIINSTTDNIFQGGGSKDTLGIQSGQWLYTGSKPQPKDDLEHSYAAAYTLAGGDLGIYVGADRYSNNGDSTIAFWFFQDGTVGLGTKKVGGGLAFTGKHNDGDLLLISDFTQGGSNSTIHAFVWQGSDATGTLVDKGTLPTTQGFAIVNGVNKTSPWTFTDKDNTGGGNTFAPGEFFEGGVDLNAIYGANIPCFSTFMAETRSSQSPTATLSDFTPPRSFPLCGVSIAKVCSGAGALNADHTTIHYLFASTAASPMVINNTGIGTLSHVTIVDTPPAGAANVAFKATAPNATLNGALMATLSAVGTVSCPAGSPTGAVCTDVGSIPAHNYVAWSVSLDLASLSASNSAIAEASTTAGTTPGGCSAAGTICSASSGDSCSATVSNTVSILKSCGIPSGYPIPGGIGSEASAVQGTQLFASGTQVAVNVNFSGTITNNGDSTLSSIAVTDVPNATISIAWPGTAGTLAPGAQATYSGTYVPSSISSGDGTGAGRYGFTDNIFVSGAKASLGSAPPASSTCTAIPGAPAGSQSCDAKTCNICFGDPANLGLCTPAF